MDVAESKIMTYLRMVAVFVVLNGRLFEKINGFR